MKKHKTHILLYLLLLLFAISCTTRPVVVTEKKADVDFSKFESFAYLPGGDTAEYRTILEQKVIKEVNQQMKVRGYDLDTEDPELLVLVKTMFGEKERLTTAPAFPTSYDYYTQGFNSGSSLSPLYFSTYPSIQNVNGIGTVREIAYIEGTFVVDVIDRSLNKIIWRGWSETPVDKTDLDTSIRNYIATIFKEYPLDPVTEK